MFKGSAVGDSRILLQKSPTFQSEGARGNELTIIQKDGIVPGCVRGEVIIYNEKGYYIGICIEDYALNERKRRTGRRFHLEEHTEHSGIAEEAAEIEGGDGTHIEVTANCSRQKHFGDYGDRQANDDRTGDAAAL
ncbi:unnamed protein product [Heligmosomoides polygyrus]|uniref:CN hydrolase domain-containing protein n=1 Tax=Heligmosomoides polygyrus TaxID=6339 RepID=A0A183FGW6_HELPZ|nr:unnamed protein product [Heligmosomoides polygyrus]